MMIRNDMRREHQRKLRSIGLMVAAVFLLTQLVVAADVLARAGGGGSSSGGGSHSSSHSSSFSSSGSSGYSSSTPLTAGQIEIGAVLAVVFAALFIVAAMRAAKKQEQARKELQARLVAAAAKDPSWDPKALEARVNEVFLAFQKAWSELDTQTMSSLLTDNYYRRMVLELGVLANLKRRNEMTDCRIYTCEILSFQDSEDDSQDWFEAKIFASAHDSIIDTSTGKSMFTDVSGFTEYWRFRRETGVWKLDVIRQATESAAMREQNIADFAGRNGFYYDPDFGWLMMPDKGVLFGAYGFGKADINNHVVGYYRNKIVEFYTYRPDPKNNTSSNYVVAQAILPKSYHDIWIKKRGWMDSCPSSLRQMSLEFGDFNKKFLVCAHPEDQVNSLELLTPNFMEKIFDLPFELNIELVGNVLYFYTKKRDASYDQMLQILAWAFDEMKM